MNYIHEATYEDVLADGTVVISAEVRITYSVTWGCPARIHYDEHDHPAEADELEITKFEIQSDYMDITRRKILAWRKPTQDESDILDAWVENLREDMLEEARDMERDAEAEARELATADRDEVK